MPPYRLQPIVEDFLSQNLYMISSTKDALAHPLGVSVGQVSKISFKTEKQ